MNDGGVVVHYLFNLDRGLCDFSTAAASVIMHHISEAAADSLNLGIELSGTQTTKNFNINLWGITSIL